jgi:hypothetical protein
MEGLVPKSHIVHRGENMKKLKVMLSMGVPILLAVIFSPFTKSSNAQTIVGIETESYFYCDGKMKRSDGQFEITYCIEGDTITRTKVYDKLKKEVIPDDTVFHIQTRLLSHPKTIIPFSDHGNSQWYPLPATVRAIGQPGLDAVEILVIGRDFIQSCKSTSNWFVISRFRRIR